MGKAQSKRSVDITTENKKAVEDEVTEKMEKIDVDKKEVVNGDANISEKCDPEKKDTEEVENDKDMTTEKETDASAGDNSAESPNAVETSKEDGGGSANAEEISPLADESIKKSKKEKVKKKWSFRSISFGKKDKQKPAKTEDGGEDGSETTNGAVDTDEKINTEPENCEKNKNEDEKEEKTMENHENGNATPQEIKEGEQNEEKNSDEKSNDITANTTNNTTTETSESVQNENTAETTELTEKTENAVNPPTPIKNENKTTENVTTDDASNGVDEKNITTEQKSEQNEVTNESVEAPADKISSDASNEPSPATNGEVIDQIHQNGDHGESEQEVVEKSKELNEVNPNTDNTVSAATLDINSSTSINPSNIQIHVQDLNISSETLDENVQIENNESDVQTSTDNEVKTSHTDAQSSNSEAADSMIENFTNNVQIETENLGSEINSAHEKSTEDKFGVEPSPPPLPISPPPSQVSVFAFTNNESVEDSIETKNFEETTDNTIKAEDEEILPPSALQCVLPPMEQTNNTNELAEENDIELKENMESECNEINNDGITSQILDDDIKNDVANIKHVEAINESVEFVCDKIQEDLKKLPINDCNEKTTFEDSDNNDESSIVVATELINEITEKAAEIVNDQLKCNEEEQILNDHSTESNEECNEDISKEIEVRVNESTIVEPDNKNLNDIEEYVSGITSNSNENSTLNEQINNIATDCSFSTSNSKLEDQMISPNKCDNLDEEKLNPTKDFANAKDNVTVAEITQDLSVTCE